MISEQERAKRQGAVDNALASIRLEGLEPNDAGHAIFRRYVDGELTIDEMDEEIRALHARQFGPVYVSRD